MHTIAVQSYLDANLAAIARRDAHLASRLREVPPQMDVQFLETPQGVPAVLVDGKQLCSRQRPLDEAKKLAEGVDLTEHAALVVLGFGAGWHVKALAERMGKNGVIIVFEPDLALLRAVLERIDCSRWLNESIVLWAHDPTDRGHLTSVMSGAEPIIAQGVEFLDHPPSRPRLGQSGAEFTRLFVECMTSARTTLMTTLMRSVDTVRNLLLNVDHYATGPGVADLRSAAKGFPAVVVSAGPSLHRNMQLLSRPGVRDRCVIIAVQTTLKPLLAAGIRPHFVTALDFHETSGRFYEGLTARDVEGVTLVVEPKVHPIVPDAFPGPPEALRCAGSDVLDRLLGPHARPMGELPAGATVAHLAVYLAHYLGCDPIAMIGQDLGFTDGLYYAPGTAIHDVWAPELNPFNTIAMMEWQRIVRHRSHLEKMKDAHGRPIYSDGQMVTYLQQFERDFAKYSREGVRIIDATEGGVAKQHVRTMPLADVLAQFAGPEGGRALPPLAAGRVDDDAKRMKDVQQRVGGLRRDVAMLRETSRRTVRLLEQMIADQADRAKMAKHFKRLEKHQREVQDRPDAFALLNQLNQLGAYKRLRADRRLAMQQTLKPVERQRLELERDIENVRWIADAADEMLGQLAAAEQLLAGGKGQQVNKSTSRQRKRGPVDLLTCRSVDLSSRTAAMVPVDPERNALGVPRSLREPFNGRPVIQATLERLGRAKSLHSIVLIVPQGVDVDSLIDRTRIARPVEVERLAAGVSSPFGRERPAIAAARLWSDTSWRGGIAGMSVYDEVLCPQIMAEIMERRKLTAALLAAPDWPLIDADSCDAVVRRHQSNPEQLRLVFTQAPPGLCGCVVSQSLLQELSQRNRLSIIGGLLMYQPHKPQVDPIGSEATVQIDHAVRRSLVRATFDAKRWRRLIEGVDGEDAVAVIATLEERFAAPPASPQHVMVELCTTGQQLPLELAERIIGQLAEIDDAALTLHGDDAISHPHFDAIIRMAKDAGVRGVHVRTSLRADKPALDRLLASGVDVISVDLHADRAATYQTMMGSDDFARVLGNIQHLIDHRERLTDQPGTAALAVPWIVPCMQRRAETYEDIESFFDRWQYTLGTAVIEAPPQSHEDSLMPAVTPQRVIERESRRCMEIACDGSVRTSRDREGAVAGDLAHDSLAHVWARLMEMQAAHKGEVVPQ